MNQFNVPVEKIKSINIASHNVQLDWSLEIDNAGPAPESEILAMFRNLRMKSHVEHKV